MAKTPASGPAARSGAIVVYDNWNRTVVIQGKRLVFDRILPNDSYYLLNYLARYREGFESIVVSWTSPAHWLVDGLVGASYKTYLPRQPEWGGGQTKLSTVDIVRVLRPDKLPRDGVVEAVHLSRWSFRLRDTLEALGKLLFNLGGGRLREKLEVAVNTRAMASEKPLSMQEGRVSLRVHDFSVEDGDVFVEAAAEEARRVIGESTVKQQIDAVYERYEQPSATGGSASARKPPAKSALTGS